ncbi:MAG: hypothetical protein WCF20_01710 [Methylovirgula sp.]
MGFFFRRMISPEKSATFRDHASSREGDGDAPDADALHGYAAFRHRETGIDIIFNADDRIGVNVFGAPDQSLQRMFAQLGLEAFECGGVPGRSRLDPADLGADPSAFDFARRTNKHHLIPLLQFARFKPVSGSSLPSSHVSFFEAAGCVPAHPSPMHGRKIWRNLADDAVLHGIVIEPSQLECARRS